MSDPIQMKQRQQTEGKSVREFCADDGCFIASKLDAVRQYGK